MFNSGQGTGLGTTEQQVNIVAMGGAEAKSVIGQLQVYEEIRKDILKKKRLSTYVRLAVGGGALTMLIT